MARSSVKPRADLADRVVDAALERAEADGWHNMSLHSVAADLGVSLAEIREEFRDLDAVANAWFGRALTAMIQAGDDAAAGLPAPEPERLYRVIMTWFEALSPHRRVTGQMIAVKLHPSHPHHWVPLVFNLSRTVHWIRDAARLQATGFRRQIEEVGLTALLLATLGVWLRDENAGSKRTRRFLAKRLFEADRAMAILWPDFEHRPQRRWEERAERRP